MAKKHFLSERLLEDAMSLLRQIGFPARYTNERTAICLLATLDVKNDGSWSTATAQLIGIRGILDFARTYSNRDYAENTRETVRDESIKQLVASGVLVLNPDDPNRKINSPKTVYAVTQEALQLVKSFGSPFWQDELVRFSELQPSLIERYARVRQMHRVPVVIKAGSQVSMSPGEHSALTKKILEEFCERFVPGAEVVYVGDTESKWGAFFDNELAKTLKISPKIHGQMPDVVVFDRRQNWLVLIEAVISNGPVDDRRREELSKLFMGCSASLVFVTAFPSRAVMRKYLADLAWESEAWCADSPTHMIHFNGHRFLGPYESL
jgi:hypothetical protein